MPTPAPTAFKQVADNALSSTSTNLSNPGVTSITLDAGDGVKFPVLGNGYILTLWTGPDPGQDPNVEDVTVTGRTGDTLTISATTRSHPTPCAVGLLITAASIKELQTAVNAAETAIANVGQQTVGVVQTSGDQTIGGKKTFAGEIVVPNPLQAFNPTTKQYVDAFAGGGVNVKSFGVVGDGSTDDTATLQAAFDWGTANTRKIYIPNGTYRLTDTLVISGRADIVGESAFANYGGRGNLQTDWYSCNIPNPTQPLSGVIFRQDTAGKTAILCTGSGVQVHLQNIGITFGSSIININTGHGIQCKPAAYGPDPGLDNGLMSSQWRNLYVFGHDGNHYAYQVYNQLYCIWHNLYSWGGGGLNFINQSTNNGGRNVPIFYGNLAADQLFFTVLCRGSAHACYLQAVANYPDLFSFGRLQGVVSNTNDFMVNSPAKPSLSSGQKCFTCSGPITMISILAPDFENSFGATSSLVDMPAYGGGFFLGPGGYIDSMNSDKSFPIIGGNFSVQGSKTTHLTNNFQIERFGTAAATTLPTDTQSALKLPAGLAQAPKTITAAYTVLKDDGFLLVDSSAAAITLTLPAASTCTGAIFHVKDLKGTSATNNITVARAGTDTIEGNTSVVLNTAYQRTRFYSTGSSYLLM